jgi:hypothetical protein
MKDLKVQMQLFAILGKLRKLVNTWLESCDRSPGSENALVIRLENIISDIETHKEAFLPRINGNDDIADD